MNINKGSVSIEASLIMPSVIVIFLFIIGIMRLFLLYNCVSEAMYETVDFAMDYAIIYHKNGICKLSDTLKKTIGDKLNVSNILNYGDDLIYKTAFQEYFKKVIENNETYNTLYGDCVTWDFSGSSFFNEGEEIYLTGNFKYKLNLPFINNIYNGFSFRKSISVRVFTDGESPYVSDTDQSSVWCLSNFERGRIIEKKYGANLPEFFPVIDVFEKGFAKMIVSINHTLASYQNINNLEKQLDNTLDKMRTFNGAEYGNTIINNNDILKKEIITVFPEDDFSDSQQNVINDFIQKANKLNISIQIQRYEKADI